MPRKPSADVLALATRLLAAEASIKGSPVNQPETAALALWPLLAGRAEEALAVLALDRRKRLISTAILTIGCDAFTVVDPRQVYRWALMQGRSGAAAVIIAHNHPSGDPAPSPQDREVTRRVAGAGRILGIPLLDHLVVADNPEDPTQPLLTSFAENGDLPMWGASPLVTA